MTKKLQDGMRVSVGQALPDFTVEQVAAFDSYLSAALQAISGVRHELYISSLARERLGEAHEALMALNDSWCVLTWTNDDAQ